VRLDGSGVYDRDCEVDEIGVIAVAGLSVIPGYVDEADNEGLFLGDGWLQNGDLGRIDEDGYLWVTGRAKDLIIRGGHNIDPRVIDETLQEHEDVALAAAVGKPDAYAGELPVAYVQLHPGAKASVEEIKAFAQARIPERAAAPREIHVIEAMPLTQVGKIFKPALRLDAAGRVFSELLAPLAGNGVALSVAVGEDARLGSLATVTLTAEDSRRAEEVEKEIHHLLGDFTLPHKIIRA
jgi:fatty-acyl-CoA synthase